MDRGVNYTIRTWYSKIDLVIPYLTGSLTRQQLILLLNVLDAQLAEVKVAQKRLVCIIMTCLSLCRTLINMTQMQAVCWRPRNK